MEAKGRRGKSRRENRLIFSISLLPLETMSYDRRSHKLSTVFSFLASRATEMYCVTHED